MTINKDLLQRGLTKVPKAIGVYRQFTSASSPRGHAAIGRVSH